MAGAFTPRFVDLVRNTTTTVGTGNFTLGPAASGFTSFASAIQPGESFYYSCIGVTKPDEREVGRGTMQADGTISRDPISGVLTDFTAGPKTIALVTAAEWFAKVDQAGGAASPILVADRAELAAANAQPGAVRLLAESGREGLFKLEGSDLSELVAADPMQAIYVAPDSDPTGASGAWVRIRENDHLHIDWFGAAGDGTTDDTPAFVAMRTLAIALTTDGAVGIARGPEIRLGPKDYFLASSFDCKGWTGLWRGCGAHLEQMWQSGRTIIRMASGATWYFSSSNTEGAGMGTSIASVACMGSEFHNITWRGPGKGVGTANVAHMRSMVVLYDCRFMEAGNHGLAITATIGGGGAAEGNANLWQAFNCSFTQNGGSGLFTNGSDANAGNCWGCSFTGNARYGTEEESFLGNNYYGCHWNGNTLGHVHGTNPNNTSRFGDYFESGYPVSVIPPRSVAYGTNSGLQVDGASYGANDAIGSGKGVAAVNGFQIFKSEAGKSYNSVEGAQPGTNPGKRLTYTDFCGGSKTMHIGFAAGVDKYIWNLGGLDILAINGNQTGAYNYGRSGYTYGPIAIYALVLGDGTSVNGRMLLSTDSVPASGDFAAGEVRFTRTPLTQKCLARQCVAGHATSGGTWYKAGAHFIDAAQPYDPPSLAAGGVGSEQTVAVSGAAPGDHVRCSFSLDSQGVELIGRVSAADTVTFFARNPTVGTVDLASGTVNIRVEKA